MECGPWIPECSVDVMPVERKACKSYRSCRHKSKSSLGKNSLTKSTTEGPESLTSGSTRRTTRSSHDRDMTYQTSFCEDDDSVFYGEPSRYDTPQSTFWLGCEFIYSLKTETIKIKIVQNGELPSNYGCGQKLFADIVLYKDEKCTKKSVNLGTVGNPKKLSAPLLFKEHSCYRAQHMSLEVVLYMGRGLFRSPELLDTWAIPLTDCHFLYPRTKWHHIN